MPQKRKAVPHLSRPQIMRNSCLSPHARLVWSILEGDRPRPDGGALVIITKQIAQRDTGMSMRTLRRYLCELKKVNLVHYDKRSDYLFVYTDRQPDPRERSYEYTIVDEIIFRRTTHIRGTYPVTEVVCTSKSGPDGIDSAPPRALEPRLDPQGDPHAMYLLSTTEATKGVHRSKRPNLADSYMSGRVKKNIYTDYTYRNRSNFGQPPGSLPALAEKTPLPPSPPPPAAAAAVGEPPQALVGRAALPKTLGYLDYEAEAVQHPTCNRMVSYARAEQAYLQAVAESVADEELGPLGIIGLWVVLFRDRFGVTYRPRRKQFARPALVYHELGLLLAEGNKPAVIAQAIRFFMRERSTQFATIRFWELNTLFKVLNDVVVKMHKTQPPKQAAYAGAPRVLRKE